MRFMRRPAGPAALGAACAAAGVIASGAPGASTTTSCAPVRNPYPGTRYEGTDLSHIRATGVSCATARRVARGAHRRALDIGISQGPIVRFSWDGWHVVGDLRPDVDPYVATRGTKRVRWRF
jgi:hypothetical protein